MKRIFDLNLIVADEHPVFAGHFPGDPVVPGALLLQWIVDAIQEQPFGIRIVEVKSMKFLNPVRPGQKLRIVVRQKASQLLIECVEAGSSDEPPRCFAKGKVCC